jgi:hypothetical protein
VSAASVSVGVDLQNTARDLDAISGGIDDTIAVALALGAVQIAAGAPALAPRGAPSWQRSSGASLPRLRDTYFARSSRMSASVGSLHPAAQVWEWGGTIAPSVHGGTKVALATRPSAVIHIPQRAAVHRAAAAAAGNIEETFAGLVDELLHT